MAGNRLFFAVQAAIFYRGRDWDDLETAAKENGTGGVPDYDIAVDDQATPFIAHGVQDVSLTSNFTLTPVFQVGQSAVYEQLEGIPTVEITLSKALDGKNLLWHLSTMDAPNPTLMGRTGSYCTFQLALWPDTEERCFWNGDGGYDDTTGEMQAGTDPPRSVSPIGVITMPKCYPSNLGYTVNVTDMATENLSLSGNEKVWARALRSNKPLPDGSQAIVISEDARFRTAFADFQGNDDVPEEMIARGHNVMLSSQYIDDNGNLISGAPRDANGALNDPDCSVFPIEIPGITMWGTNDVTGNINRAEEPGQADPNYARIQSVSISVALTRNDVNTLGFKMPVFRNVQVPIAVTSEVAVHATTDDGIQVASFTTACRSTAALRNGTIRLAICNGHKRNPEFDPSQPVTGANLPYLNEAGAPSLVEGAAEVGVRIYLGEKNKLTSVGMAGGGTGGGNVVNTYSYQTYNECTVLSTNDPTLKAIDENWWTNRVNHVCGRTVSTV